MVKSFLLLGLAGAMGTWARVGLSRGVQEWVSLRFPVGTLVVNLIGCFAFGCVWAAAEQKAWLDERSRQLICIGFLGAFTTFSTFAFDNAQSLRAGQLGPLILNVVISNVAGIAAAWLGLRWIGSYAR